MNLDSKLERREPGQLSQPSAFTGSSSTLAPGPAASARSRRRLRLGIQILAAGLGAGSGYYFGRQLGFAVIGALLGYLVGRMFGARCSEEHNKPSCFPNAHLCLVLSVGAWMLVLAFGCWVSSAGLLRGEGASLLLFMIVLPVVVICWLVGGPMASLVGRNALEQIKAGTRPQDDRWLARVGMALSRSMTLILLGSLAWLLSLILA